MVGMGLTLTLRFSAIRFGSGLLTFGIASQFGAACRLLVWLCSVNSMPPPGGLGAGAACPGGTTSRFILPSWGVVMALSIFADGAGQSLGHHYVTVFR